MPVISASHEMEGEEDVEDAEEESMAVQEPSEDVSSHL